MAESWKARWVGPSFAKLSISKSSTRRQPGTRAKIAAAILSFRRRVINPNANHYILPDTGADARLRRARWLRSAVVSRSHQVPGFARIEGTRNGYARARQSGRLHRETIQGRRPAADRIELLPGL